MARFRTILTQTGGPLPSLTTGLCLVHVKFSLYSRQQVFPAGVVYFLPYNCSCITIIKFPKPTKNWQLSGQCPI